MNFEDYTKTRLGARWFRYALGDAGDKFLTVVGGMFDLARDGVKLAVKAGLVGECPEDAIPYHAQARNIEQLVSETLEAWRVRLLDAWTHWQCGPTAKLRDILRLYAPAEALEVYDIAFDGWAAATVLWPDSDDDNADNWSRHVVVIPQPHSWERPVVGTNVVVGPDQLVGVTMTGTELHRIRRAYRKYRPGHMVGIDLYVLFDGTPAEDVLDFHDASDCIRIPLGPVGLVGYKHHQMTVGTSMVVGAEYK